MDTVIEINKLGQVVDALPLNRFVLAKARSNGLEIWTVVPQLTVTVHAGLRWRHAGGRCRFNRCVTVAAIYAVVAYVMLVAELDRLLDLEILSGQVRRSCDLCVNVKYDSGQYNNHHHADPRYVVCTSVKELRHLLLSCSRT
jgi:hypothetical protein